MWEGCRSRFAPHLCALDAAEMACYHVHGRRNVAQWIGAVVSVRDCSALTRSRYHFGYDSNAGRTMVLSDLFVKPGYVGVALIAKMLAH